MVYNRGRHHFRTEGHTYSKGRSICAGRQGCLSFIRTDERASCKGSKSLKRLLCVHHGADGKVYPSTLVAANEAGVDEIYKVGGAQAIAAMAFGTESVPKVDKIVGPGNIFVALCQKGCVWICQH